MSYLGPMSDPAPLGAAVLLFADHDFLIGEMLEDALREEGFTVHRSASAMQAIRILDNASDIAALVVDAEGDGNFSGWRVAIHARQIRKEIAVLYLASPDAGAGVRDCVPGGRIILKPFSTSRAVASLRRLLEDVSDWVAPRRGAAA